MRFGHWDTSHLKILTLIRLVTLLSIILKKNHVIAKDSINSPFVPVSGPESF